MQIMMVGGTTRVLYLLSAITRPWKMVAEQVKKFYNKQAGSKCSRGIIILADFIKIVNNRVFDEIPPS